MGLAAARPSRRYSGVLRNICFIFAGLPLRRYRWTGNRLSGV
jgi:hypothetical protein